MAVCSRPRVASPARLSPPREERPALPRGSVASVGGGPVRSPGAGVTHGPSFVVSALRATAAARAVLLGRGPEDRCRAGAPAGRAKLARDCMGAGPWTAAGQPRGAHPGRGRDSAYPRPTPPPPRIIQVSKPAILQTEHFVNLHREQIQQSRVEPFFFCFFFERSVTLTCPPLSSHPCGPPPSGIRSEGWEAGVSVLAQAGLGRWGEAPQFRRPRNSLVTPQSPAPPRGILSCGFKGVIVTGNSRIVLHVLRQKAREAALCIVYLQNSQCYC